MKIIVDAFGGDNAPLEIIKGCAMAVQEYGVDLILTGDEEKIRSCAKENGISLDRIEIEHAPLVMPVEAEYTGVMKSYKESSLAVGLSLLAQGKGDAFLTAGSTGALVVGSSLIVKRLKGVKRAALGVCIPMEKGCYMLMDGGANSECRPEMLLQFSIMGNAYMKRVMGLENPRVALVNNGTEETKGTDLQKEAYALLKKAPVNFIGNVEARELPLCGCDVAVTDGFTGNVILKLTEGMGKLMANQLKHIFKKSLVSKMAAGMVMGSIKEVKAKMDYTEYGGTPLLGISKTVIKAHGSSNAKAIKNAIRQAKSCVEMDVVGQIKESLEQYKATAEQAGGQEE